MLSAFDAQHFPADEGVEIACCGRSNAGKSSALNALMGRKNLARTSKTPGRTREINFFSLDAGDQRRLVDLPGYGYARVSKSERRSWGVLVDDYLDMRASLSGVLMVVDIRRGLLDFDRQMLAWCGAAELPVLILLSKADRLSKSHRSNAVREHRGDAEVVRSEAAVLAFSSTTRLGLDEARQWLSDHLTGTADGRAP
ncbi:MAG: YihA family ribosome biogenesis GTP-binding protein [Gammaproteobacteria bacterium AqS3]|nr:YihA family ribosome biogenesis GTP-binding protein [Gammaproteobacteria bacterium AqS3]